jgi:hypothetical protein
VLQDGRGCDDGAVPPRRTTLLLAGLVAVEIATHLLGFGIWRGRVGALNSDSEAGVFMWFGTVAVGAAAIGAVLRRRWLVAALLAFLCVGDGLHLSHSLRHGMFVYAPVLLVAALLLWRRGSRELRVGVLVLALSLVIHKLGPPLLARFGWGPADWAYQVKIAFKQGTQLGGWALIAVALLRRPREERVGGLVEQAGVRAERRRPLPLAERDPVELV